MRASTIVEADGRFTTYGVGGARSGETGFTHFLDGIQKTRLVAYVGAVPLVYGYTAAAIRIRNGDRRMETWGLPRQREQLYAPYIELDIAELTDRGIPVYDTSRSAPGVEPPNPAQFRQAAAASVQRVRADLEAELVQGWLQASNEGQAGWLLVDGSLPFGAQHPRVLGVVKSHRTHYFASAEQAAVLRLEEGERSPVFQPGFAEGADVYSWYLRLHAVGRRDLLHGLIRVEVDRRPEVIEQASAISAWLMAERQPISAPDPRWDKMLYPIRDCEEYLKSLAPSNASIDGFLGA